MLVEFTNWFKSFRARYSVQWQFSVETGEARRGKSQLEEWAGLKNLLGLFGIFGEGKSGNLGRGTMVEVGSKHKMVLVENYFIEQAYSV